MRQNLPLDGRAKKWGIDLTTYSVSFWSNFRKAVQMKLSFSWFAYIDTLFPMCTSSRVNDEGLSPLACLLIDDGGLGIELSIQWIDEGIKRIDSVLSGTCQSASWDREVWGAEFFIDKVVVYYHGGGSEEIIDSCAVFKTVLLKWREFTQSEPDVGVVQELEVPG
jgi:hypothetical protein